MRKWDEETNQAEVSRKTGLFEKFLNVLGIEAEELSEDELEAAPGEEQSRKNHRERGRVLSLANSNKNVKVMILEPTGFDEVQGIVDHLKNKRAVIINLEETEKLTARRIADFLGGAIYALEGNMQKISGSIFLFTPAHMEVTIPLRAELKEREKERTTTNSQIFSSTLYRSDRER